MLLFVAGFSLGGLTAIQLVRRRWEGAVGSTLSESTQGMPGLLPGRASDHRYTRHGRSLVGSIVYLFVNGFSLGGLTAIQLVNCE